jgi:hypothetical protein
MKRILVIALAAMTIFGCMALARPIAVRVNIPFAFHAGDAILPAGEYELKPFYQSDLLLLVRRLDGPDGAFMPARQAETLKGTPAYSISFNRYGDEYFMASMDNGDFKVNMPKTKAERKLAGDNLKGTIIAYLVR